MNKAHEEYRQYMDKYTQIRDVYEERIIRAALSFQEHDKTHLTQMKSLQDLSAKTTEHLKGSLFNLRNIWKMVSMRMPKLVQIIDRIWKTLTLRRSCCVLSMRREQGLNCHVSLSIAAYKNIVFKRNLLGQRQTNCLRNWTFFQESNRNPLQIPPQLLPQQFLRRNQQFKTC